MISTEYAAGIVDGEGCIGFYSRKGGRNSGRIHTVSLTVCMTCLPVLQALKQKYAGSISARTKIYGQNKQQYAWSVCSDLAYRALLDIAPHLIEKKEQAQLAIEIREWQLANSIRGKGHGKHDPNIEALCQKAQEYDKALKSLKTKEFF